MHPNAVVRGPGVSCLNLPITGIEKLWRIGNGRKERICLRPDIQGVDDVRLRGRDDGVVIGRIGVAQRLGC